MTAAVEPPLARRRVTIVGAGGLGSPAVLMLANQGLTELRVIDSDRIELSNLQRQILHRTSNVGRPKIASLETLGGKLSPIEQRLTAVNARQLLADSDLILDGTDNFESRFLINDVACELRIPCVFAGVLRYAGQVLSVIPHQTACYRCLFVEPPPEGVAERCSDAGVFGALVGMIAAIQVAEGRRILRDQRPTYADRLLSLDLAAGRVRVIPFRRRADCEACGVNR